MGGNSSRRALLLIKIKRSKNLKTAIKKYIAAILLIFSIIFLTIAPLRKRVTNLYENSCLHISESLQYVATALNLNLKNVRIEGLDYISQQAILETLNLGNQTNLFSLNTQDIAISLQKIGWIQHAHIYKQLPNTLSIKITEHKPYALWQHFGKVFVITEKGVVIPSATPKNFGALTLVIGENANLHCKQLLDIFDDYPTLKDKLSALQYMYKRRWRLHLNSGIIVDLPEDDVGNAIHKLYTLHQQQKILDRDVKIIDIRIPNRLIIKGSSVVGQQKS